MQTKRTYTLQEATKRLEHYCAYQERCHQDVRKKLESLHMIPEAIDTIIVHLLEHNYLNETRFAKTFARGKFKFKYWGRHRISLELKKRDVSKYNINEGIKEISDKEYLNMFDFLSEKKADSIKETNIYKKRKKFVDYFLYRGWESHLVYDRAVELIN